MSVTHGSKTILGCKIEEAGIEGSLNPDLGVADPSYWRTLSRLPHTWLGSMPNADRLA
jgi:hypothetical protein